MSRRRGGRAANIPRFFVVQASSLCRQNVRLRLAIQIRRDISTPMIIETASIKDASAILALQRLAYQSEADLYQDPQIQPLTQSLAEVKAEFANQIILKGRVDRQIVASVRGRLQAETCFVSKLIVHPDWQNRGLGSQLMLEVERRFPEAKRFEICTGYRSARNLHLYNKLGYKEFRRQPIHNRLTMAFMEKQNPVPD